MLEIEPILKLKDKRYQLFLSHELKEIIQRNNARLVFRLGNALSVWEVSVEDERRIFPINYFIILEKKYGIVVRDDFEEVKKVFPVLLKRAIKAILNKHKIEKYEAVAEGRYLFLYSPSRDEYFNIDVDEEIPPTKSYVVVMAGAHGREELPYRIDYEYYDVYGTYLFVIDLEKFNEVINRFIRDFYKKQQSLKHLNICPSREKI